MIRKSNRALNWCRRCDCRCDFYFPTAATNICQLSHRFVCAKQLREQTGLQISCKDWSKFENWISQRRSLNEENISLEGWFMLMLIKCKLRMCCSTRLDLFNWFISPFHFLGDVQMTYFFSRNYNYNNKPKYFLRELRFEPLIFGIERNRSPFEPHHTEILSLYIRDSYIKSIIKISRLSCNK